MSSVSRGQGNESVERGALPGDFSLDAPRGFTLPTAVRFGSCTTHGTLRCPRRYVLYPARRFVKAWAGPLDAAPGESRVRLGCPLRCVACSWSWSCEGAAGTHARVYVQCILCGLSSQPPSGPVRSSTTTTTLLCVTVAVAVNPGHAGQSSPRTRTHRIEDPTFRVPNWTEPHDTRSPLV